ncbi:hypothetical protein Aperf_G00000072691 [Anoplocephala perfoliata]
MEMKNAEENSKDFYECDGTPSWIIVRTNLKFIEDPYYFVVLKRASFAPYLSSLLLQDYSDQVTDDTGAVKLARVEPRDVVTSSYAANSITVFWKPPLSNTEPISFYEITAVDTQDEKKIVKVFNQATNGTINNLKSFEQYQVHVSACVRGKYCGASAIISAITAPEGKNAPPSPFSPICFASSWLIRGADDAPETSLDGFSSEDCEMADPLTSTDGMFAFDKFLTTKRGLIRLGERKELTNVTVLKRTESSLLVAWHPSKQDSEPITQYKIIVSNGSSFQPSMHVLGTTAEALVNNLEPKTRYRVRISACARDNDCGFEEETTAWTTPKKPRGLQVKSVESGALSFEWDVQGDNYNSDTYEVDLFTLNASHPLQNVTLLAKERTATFKGLPSHAEFLAKVRACFFRESSHSNLCSEPATSLGVTQPDPAKVDIIERTPSSIVFRLIGPVNTSHFNYTLQVLNKPSNVFFDSQKYIFTALSLPENSMITASLLTCCKHNICSMPFKIDASTKSEGSQIRITAIVLSFLVLLLAILVAVAIGFCQRILRIVLQIRYWQEKIYALEL